MLLVWVALRRSQKDARLSETLTLWPERMHLIRRGPHGRVQEWEANPYWVTIRLHRKGGPVENYVTMRGNGREVEIGAFLSEDERVSLHAELQCALSDLRARAGSSVDPERRS